MSKLQIRFSRKPDGSTVFACTRADGSQTWQRHDRHADFFPLHDLAHYAVETCLGLRHGFYGLVAGGWNVTDFGERQIPPGVAAEAMFSEVAAGLLDGERATGQRYDADAFNAALAAKLDELGHGLERPVERDELEAIRVLWLDLAYRWSSVPPGGSLELEFEAAGAGVA
jgi:hypothetical protein